MLWYHRSNPDWLRARCDYLTASDVAALWPETATGKNRVVTDEDYMAIIFKMREFDASSVTSYNAAARGHLLEPYALDEFHAQLPNATRLHHWDDALIHSDGLLAFSPDALDIPQPDDSVSHDLADLATINIIGEVKCYGADKHFTTWAKGRMTVERIQLATALYICTEAKGAELILYNPRLDTGSLLVTTWHRDDMGRELDMIDGIAARLACVLDRLERRLLPPRKGPSEEEILDQLHESGIVRGSSGEEAF
jgi:hypothetical protein